MQIKIYLMFWQNYFACFEPEMEVAAQIKAAYSNEESINCAP